MFNHKCSINHFLPKHVQVVDTLTKESRWLGIIFCRVRLDDFWGVWKVASSIGVRMFNVTKHECFLSWTCFSLYLLQAIELLAAFSSGDCRVSWEEFKEHNPFRIREDWKIIFRCSFRWGLVQSLLDILHTAFTQCDFQGMPRSIGRRQSLKKP